MRCRVNLFWIMLFFPLLDLDLRMLRYFSWKMTNILVKKTLWSAPKVIVRMHPISNIIIYISHLFGYEYGNRVETHHFNFRLNVFQSTEPYVSWCLKHLSLQPCVCVCVLRRGVPATWGYPPSSVGLLLHIFPVLSLAVSLSNCPVEFFSPQLFFCALSNISISLPLQASTLQLMVLQAVTLYSSAS